MHPGLTSARGRPLLAPESSKAPLAECGCPTRTHGSLSPSTRFRTLSDRSVIASP